MIKLQRNQHSYHIAKIGTIGLLAGLTFGLVSCATNPFQSEPVPEPRYVPDIVLGDMQQLRISSIKTPCDTQLPMLCLTATNLAGQMFQIPYDAIEGFSHATGVQYDIIVRPQIDSNNQQMIGKWVLVKVESQDVL